MQGEATDLPFVYVLRRLAPLQMEEEKVRPAAFHIKETHTGLSVYAPHLAAPRRLLQDYIDTRLEWLQSEDKANRSQAEKQLRQYGETVEKMYAAGWRIARVPVDAFTQFGLSVESPKADATGNQIGHCDVLGTAAVFRANDVALSESAVVLTDAETFA